MRSSARQLAVSLLVFVVGVGSTLLIGDMSTHYLVSDGLERFTGSVQTAARDALLHAQLGCGSEPADQLIRRKFQVVDVKLEPGYCALGQIPAYQAVVKSFTFFMIPTGAVSVRCGSTQCLYPADQNRSH